MKRDYTKINPVGQLDKFTGWAACLSWWLQAVGDGRPALSQSELIDEFDRYRTPGEAMPVRVLRDVIAKDSRFKISMSFYTSSHFVKRSFPVKDTPVIIIYKYLPVGGNHINVIFDKIGDTVNCMEPFFPPGVGDGKKTGKFERRPNTHFINSEEIGLAWARVDF